LGKDLTLFLGLNRQLIDSVLLFSKPASPVSLLLLLLLLVHLSLFGERLASSSASWPEIIERQHC